MVYMKTGQIKKAVAAFEMYLELDPDGKESGFVQQYLKQAKNGMNES